MKLLSAFLLAPFAVLIGSAWLFILIFPLSLLMLVLLVGIVIGFYSIAKWIHQYVVERIRLPELILNHLQSLPALASACVCVNENNGKTEMIVQFTSGENVWSHRVHGHNMGEALQRLVGKLDRKQCHSISCGIKQCANFAHCPRRNPLRHARELFRYNLSGLQAVKV